MIMHRKSLLCLLALLGTAAMVPASTMAAETVVVYSAISTKVMQAFTDGFRKKEPGIEVQVISAGTGELLSRIKAERNNPRGDVFAGPDTDVFDGSADLYANYASKEAAGFDKAAQHPEGKYYGLSTNFQVMMINTKLMPLDKAPKTWADLAKPEFKGKVLMANPAQSGSAFSQLHQIVGLYGWDVMDKIIQNATFVSSSKLAFQNVAKGEIPIGLTSEFNVVQSKEEGFPVEAIYPTDGTALINDANGLIKGGPNPANAQKFLDYINSKEAHEMLVSIDKRRSARKDVTPPAGLPSANSIKVVAYDSMGAAKNHDAELQRFDKTFSTK
jgi:iron(III) transport system substrate-binding protein